MRPLRAVIATGSGRYADPWHPFAETSDRLRRMLEEAGFAVDIAPVDDALQRLVGADLLVVNAGDPWDEDPPAVGAPAASVAGLEAALERGIGVLAMHAALSSLRDHAAWAPAVGGVWLPRASMHPPISDATFSWSAHPLAGTEPLTAFDERYAFLQAVGEREVVATHEHAGVVHPVVWVREHGAARVAVDLLGHDTRSYDSPSHRALIARLATWAVRF
ncbi:ThuA domain-containing protein [Microbacterium sp. JZ31]|uniref:ThuA domain-containing protein n=1 Tax=Microbacterium sp. JZ31 TaxID=1906274 RepID=UPI001932558D|nr:ThuA domain-containing protein [Microbacterium sp. JZ31]